MVAQSLRNLSDAKPFINDLIKQNYEDFISMPVSFSNGFPWYMAIDMQEVSRRLARKNSNF